MRKQRERKDDRPKGHDADSQAILERRRFLIQSALVGLGAGALAASCKQEPQVCLSVVAPPPKSQSGAQPCLELLPPKASTAQPGQKAGPSTQTPATKSGKGVPQVCLTPLPPKSAP